MNSGAVREMTFEEEYEILQREKERVFASEHEGCEPPLANCVLRRALRCIRKLQEQQPKTDWIPCEERLPEKYGDYLVTIIPKAGVLWQRITIARYSDLMGICVQPSFHIGEVGKESFEKLEGVVAWMPLPAPYKKEGAENEK